MERQPRAVLVAFIALQVAIPLVGLYLRWFEDQAVARWAWHMFSAAP